MAGILQFVGLSIYIHPAMLDEKECCSFHFQSGGMAFKISLHLIDHPHLKSQIKVLSVKLRKHPHSIYE